MSSMTASGLTAAILRKTSSPSIAVATVKPASSNAPERASMIAWESSTTRTVFRRAIFRGLYSIRNGPRTRRRRPVLPRQPRAPGRGRGRLAAPGRAHGGEGAGGTPRRLHVLGGHRRGGLPARRDPRARHRPRPQPHRARGDGRPLAGGALAHPARRGPDRRGADRRARLRPRGPVGRPGPPPRALAGGAGAVPAAQPARPLHRRHLPGPALLEGVRGAG